MATGDIAICAYAKCGKEFEKKTHNQKYHDNECCQLATREKAMAKYYDKKARKQGQKRICAKPHCETQLSRYNESKFCAECNSREQENLNKMFLEMIS